MAGTGPRRPVAMAHVARLAGVSVTTVSHVVDRTRSVAPETERAVLAAIAETGYLPDDVVRSLRTAGTIGGWTRANATPANLARAAFEGMLCGLADGVDALRREGLEVRRVLLIGGAAVSKAVRQVAADVFEPPVSVPAPGEYVALGAARQAA